MTLPRLAILNREWARFPPLRIAVASFLGHKPPSEIKREQPPPPPEYEP